VNIGGKTAATGWLGAALTSEKYSVAILWSKATTQHMRAASRQATATE
jgi:hypothetical protein